MSSATLFKFKETHGLWTDHVKNNKNHMKKFWKKTHQNDIFVGLPSVAKCESCLCLSPESPAPSFCEVRIDAIKIKLDTREN